MTTAKTIYKLTDTLTFGKYTGQTIAQIIASNPGYLEWATENIAWFELNQEAEDELEDALNEPSEEDYYGSFDWETFSPGDGDPFL